MDRNDRRLVDVLVLISSLRGDRDREDLLALLRIDADKFTAIFEIYFEPVLHTDVAKASSGRSGRKSELGSCKKLIYLL